MLLLALLACPRPLAPEDALGVWRDPETGDRHLVALEGGVPAVVGVGGADVALELDATRWEEHRLTWRVVAPETGYVVAFRAVRREGEALLARWRGTAGHGLEALALTAPVPEPVDDDALLGRWRGEDGEVVAVTLQDGAPAVVGAEATGCTRGVLWWDAGGASYTVLRADDAELAVRRGDGSDLRLTRALDPVPTSALDLVGRWRAVTTGTLHELAPGPMLASVVDDGGEVMRPISATLADGRLTWSYHVPSNALDLTYRTVEVHETWMLAEWQNPYGRGVAVFHRE